MLKDHPALIGRSVAREWKKSRDQRLAMNLEYERNYSRYCRAWPKRMEAAIRRREPIPPWPVRPVDYARRMGQCVLYPLCYANGPLHHNHPLYK